MSDVKAYGRSHNRDPGIRCWCRQTHEPAADEMTKTISDERKREILDRLADYDARFDADDGYVNPFQDVIAALPEYDGRATEAAGIPEHLDIYILMDGTVLEHDDTGHWHIHA